MSKTVNAYLFRLKARKAYVALFRRKIQELTFKRSHNRDIKSFKRLKIELRFYQSNVI